MEFTPEQKVLNDLFGKDISYTIPEYQRPYSWDCIGKSDKNNQVNVMWQDLIDFFESGNQNIYFMGSMVVIGDVSARKYEVVDGQQRMTTLCILIVAIKCFLKDIKQKNIVEANRKEELTGFIENVIRDLDSLLFNQNLFGSIVQEKKVKIEKISGFNYDDILASTLECKEVATDLIDANEEQKEVALRYSKNRVYFTDKLFEKFITNNVFTFSNAETLNKFIHFLKTKVTIIQIRSPRFDVAYQIFEILNNRGLPLSNKDLFRNFLISEFAQLKNSNPQKYEHINSNERWRNLEENGIDVEFISRYVESMRGKKQQYSAFNDLQELYKGKRFEDDLERTKLENFYNNIEKELINYNKIIKCSFNDNNAIQNRIAFLINAGNLAPIINLLLTLFRCTNDETKILTFLKAFEQYIIYMLLAPKARFQNSIIFDCIKNLNEYKFDNALSLIQLDNDQKNELKTCLNGTISDNTTAKIMIARCFWANENQAEDDVVEYKFDFDIATLEHIIPQNPKTDTNWEKDFTSKFRKEFTYKLGNMTLLTKEKNSSVKNFDFITKKKKYVNSKLEFTKELGNLASIDENYIQLRQQKFIELLIKDLEI